MDTEYRKKEKSLPGANKKYKTQFGKDVYKIIKVINSKPNKQYNVELVSPKTVFNELYPKRVQRQNIIKIDRDMVKTSVEKPLEIPENEYVVEKIISTKIKNGKKYYEVKWLNWPSSANTFEPYINIKEIKAYDNFLKLKKKNKLINII